MLQYITNTDTKVPVAEQVRGVIAGGCRWVQIRMKDASDEEISAVVSEIKPLCIETRTFLILNDRVLMWGESTSERPTCFRRKQG